MNAQRLEVLLDSVGRLVRRGAMAHALNILEKLRPVEVAEVLRSLSAREREATFSALCDRDRAKAAEAVSELGPEYVTELLVPLPHERLARWLDGAAELITEVAETVRKRPGFDDASTVLARGAGRESLNVQRSRRTWNSP